jgi:flagellar capping protein FliD
MAKQRATPEYVTREILKEEISASEKRLTAKIGEEISGVEKRLTVTLNSKIESTTQSLKEYTDSRFNQLDTKIKTLDSTIKTLDSTVKTLDTKIDGMDAKMTRYFEGIGSMLEGLTGTSAEIRDRLDNHEQRITMLEGRGPQASKI